jgi:hypothetical protein
MRWLQTNRRTWAILAAGAVAGGICGMATIELAAGATARIATAPGLVFDITHLPPLLTVAGEPDELVYEVHCALAGTDDPEAGCNVRGAVFARPSGRGPFRELPLAQPGTGSTRMVASVPGDLSDAPAFEYYAVFDADEVGTRTVPPGGAAAPSVSRRIDDATTVALGRHAFGESRRIGQRVAFAPWGDGPAEAGLESGRGPDPIGASAFDVDARGSVAILDHAHRRLLRWTRGARTPEGVPLSINGAIGDLAAAGDGSFYVLETTSTDDRAPLIRRFDDDGRELEAVEAAERGPTQIRMGPEGPVVLQRPSHQWMPASVAGAPASPAAQRRRGQMGRPLRAGGEVVVFRRANELRLALVATGAATRSWRITSGTPLGEVQLAEPLGARLLVVVRVYDEGSDEFALLLLDRRGLASRTTLASAEWAEGAPLGRFRLVGRNLYRLGSTSAGAFVDRFDLEVR